jgi:hypothetical protein
MEKISRKTKSPLMLAVSPFEEASFPLKFNAQFLFAL